MLNRPALIVAVLLFVAPRGYGQTTVTAEIGWGERVRAGRWMPLTVRAADARVRAAVIEVYAPQTGTYGMKVWQNVTLGPVPTTVQLYVPLYQGGAEGPVVTVRDARTGKALTHYPPDDESVTPFYTKLVDGGSRLFGVSGERTQIQSLNGQLGDLKLSTGYLEPRLLPRVLVGYDGLDVLVLNRPNLSAIAPEQQTAILDWVRGGGNLLLWPGDDPLPEDAPLTRALPCKVEGIRDYPLAPEDLQNITLPTGGAGIRGRALVADPVGGAAEEIWLFGKSPGSAFARRHGLGRIVVAPFNLSQLQFPNTAAAGTIWTPLIRGMGLLPGEGGGETGNANNYYGAAPDLRRELAATARVQESLGDIAGIGQFGFSYVAAVLIGMMVIVGPVDWFVLKKLGRQPWTWVTTTGWIGLVTLGAVYAGHAFKSGTLHYRTAAVVDQIGGQTVGETAVSFVYSPRTAEYHLDAARPPPGQDPDPPAGWWSPASVDEYNRGGLATDVSFHQAWGGNAADPMVINVWNMRLFRSDQPTAGPAVLDADLTWQPGADGKPPRVTGTVKNLTDRPLTNVHIETRLGMAYAGKPGTPLVARLEPGGSVPIDAAADGSKGEKVDADGRFNYRFQVAAAGELWSAVKDLSGRRSTRADVLMNGGGWACVYAECDDPVPPAVLREAGAVERHYKLVRAVVPIGGDPPGTQK